MVPCASVDDLRAAECKQTEHGPMGDLDKGHSRSQGECCLNPHQPCGEQGYIFDPNR